MYELSLSSLFLAVFVRFYDVHTFEHFDDRSSTWVGKEISRPLSMLLFFTAVLDKKVKTWSHSS
jgi:hypothetical protein